MTGFEFQRLRVFDAAAEAATEINSLVWRIPVRHRVVRDQVSRSSFSVPLNIAEGADEYSIREKIRFYRMARRSAAESAGALTLLVRFGVFMPGEVERALMLLNRAAAMLTAMMLRLEQGRADNNDNNEGSRRRAEGSRGRGPANERGRLVVDADQRNGPGPGAGPRPAPPQ